MNDTLASQISLSQIDYYTLIVDFERTLQDYYNLQKQVYEEVVIDSRGLDLYMKQVYSYLNDYYNTITITLLDNPGDSGCVTDAKDALDFAAKFGKGIM